MMNQKYPIASNNRKSGANVVALAIDFEPQV